MKAPTQRIPTVRISGKNSPLFVGDCGNKHLRGKRQVGFQTVYSSVPIFVNLLKPKSSLAAMDRAKLVPKANEVKDAKCKDVAKLMDYFEIPSNVKKVPVHLLLLYH